MPFRSEAQRRFMFARHPQIAKRWTQKYDTPDDLPQRVNRAVRDQLRRKAGHAR